MEPLTENPFGPHLAEKGVVLLDGGLATALEEAGHTLNTGLWSASLLRDDPDALRDVHLAYLRAGADCITTASYQASFPGFEAAGFSEAEAESLFVRSSDLALEAVEIWMAERREQVTPMSVSPASTGDLRPIVAASIGPWGAWLADGSEYDGRYGVESEVLADFHRRRFDLLARSGVDVMACETIPSGLEVEVLLGLLDEHAPIWGWLSFSCGDDRSLWDGTPIEKVARMCSVHERVAAIGVNCTDPVHVPGLVERIRKVSDLPVIVYPNSGETYDASTRCWTGDGGEWLEAVQAAIRAGARIVGGCCRIGPTGIAELRGTLERRDWAR